MVEQVETINKNILYYEDLLENLGNKHIKNLEHILAILKFEFPSNHHYELSDFNKNQ